jgi:hypothetical protein
MLSIFSIFIQLWFALRRADAPPRPPLPGGEHPPPMPPPPETDDEDEMFRHAPQANQPILVRCRRYLQYYTIYSRSRFLNTIFIPILKPDGRSRSAPGGHAVVVQGQ